MGTEAELAALIPPHDVVIVTERLILRPVRPLTDLHVLHGIRRNANAMRYMSSGVEPESDPFKCQSYNRITMMMAPGSYALAIELKPSPTVSSAEVIGFIAFFNPPALGYLFDEQYWGKGYASEALVAFVGRYWDEFPLGLPSLAPKDRNLLLAHVQFGHEASEKVLRRAGFRARGHFADESGTVHRTTFMIERPTKLAAHPVFKGDLIHRYTTC
ncbi:GNAT domain-containing protein [Xylariales sp. PMI_506]|nr:GNAT domain-containing protein [Xylariales sp. PMI_506]